MRIGLTRIFFLISIILLFYSSSAFAAAEQRTALIIGNSSYSATPLKNPVNDAEDMAKALKSLGFDVILRKNASLQDMEDSIRELGDHLKKGGVGLFFYAGHGVQIGGKNYLLPIGVQIDRETAIKYKAVDVDMVLDEMGNAANAMNIVILDACRDNPFGRSFRSASRGLAITSSTPRGTLISYSTGPGNVADDGKDRNSPYTGFLIKHMMTPGLPIEEVFKNVRQDLARQTSGKQIPWELSSLEGKFYFNIFSDNGHDPASESKKIDEERQKIARERELLEKQKAFEQERENLDALKREKAKKPPRVSKKSARLSQAPDQNTQEKSSMSGPVSDKGDIYIASDPAGAKLYLDGRERGITPLSLNDIGAGKHVIELKKGEIYTGRLEIDLQKNDFIKKTVKLKPARGRIRIFSDPDGAMIFVDALKTGKITPDIIDIEAGEHEIWLWKAPQSKPPYRRLLSYEGKHMVEPNRKMDISVKLKSYDKDELAAAVKKARMDREWIARDIQKRGGVFGPLNLPWQCYNEEDSNKLIEEKVLNIQGQYQSLMGGSFERYVKSIEILEATLKKAEEDCLSKAKKDNTQKQQLFEQCMGRDRDDPAKESPWAAYNEGMEKATNKYREEIRQIIKSPDQFNQIFMQSEARQRAAIEEACRIEIEKSSEE